MTDFVSQPNHRDQIEEIQETREELYELMEDDFDADRFYKALSNALEQLANFDAEAA
ncbi:MAG: hypothetical protein AAF529_16070 [Pseudomonadota bacterium]